MTSPAIDYLSDGSSSSDAQRRRRATGVVVEALLIVLLLPFGNLFTVTLPFHQLQLIAIGVVGTLGWISVIRRPAALSPMVIAAPLPLFVAAALTALASPYPSLSVAAVWQIAAYTGIFWLLSLQASERVGRRGLLDALAIVLFLAIGMYLVSTLMSWRDWLELGFPITTLPLRPLASGGLAVVATWLADLVALLTPVVAATLWDRRARVAAVVLVAVAFGTILLTETRSVLLLLLGVCTVATLLALRRPSRRRNTGMVIGAVIAIGIVSLAIVLGAGRSLDEGRLSAFGSAISQFAESPLVGGGPATYGVRRMSDEVDTLGLLAFPDAHNLVLTAAAESGIIGLGALSLTAVLLVWPSERPGQARLITRSLRVR